MHRIGPPGDCSPDQLQARLDGLERASDIDLACEEMRLDISGMLRRGRITRAEWRDWLEAIDAAYSSCSDRAPSTEPAQRSSDRYGSVDPFAHYLRLKKPCANCPFLKQGAIELRPGRLQSIAADLLENDHSTFQCHKTVHHPRGGHFDDEGECQASGHEAMCAGAAAYLMKKNRPTLAMRVAFATGSARPDDWSGAEALIIDDVTQAPNENE